MFRKWVLMEVELEEIKSTRPVASLTSARTKLELLEFFYTMLGWSGIYFTCVVFFVVKLLYKIGEAVPTWDCDGVEGGCGLAIIIGLAIGIVSGGILWGLVVGGFLVFWAIARHFRVRQWILYLFCAFFFGGMFYRLNYHPESVHPALFGVFVSLFMWGWNNSYKYVQRFFSKI